MKNIFLFCLLFTSMYGISQNPKPEDVMDAEKAFAAYSVEHGMKAAFLQFLDSNGVVFENGKSVNGIKSWTQKEDRPGVLNWHPVHGEMARSGDLGFTTGPWTFQPKTVKDSVVARGQYSTLWKKERGQWKFIVDLGVSQTPALLDAMYQFSTADEKFIPGNWNNLLNKEQKFSQRTGNVDSNERLKWYNLSVSKHGFFLNRNGQLPTTKNEELMSAIRMMPQKIEYTIEGSGISMAGDLGYVYGTAILDGKIENYMRIWRREGMEWRLALEVLRY